MFAERRRKIICRSTVLTDYLIQAKITMYFN